jgi:hypothetical protein
VRNPKTGFEVFIDRKKVVGLMEIDDYDAIRKYFHRVFREVKNGS